MNSSVHTGSSSKNGSHAVFHWPTAFILSQAGVGAASFWAGFTPAAFASSSRIGAPRLQEWIDMTDAHLRTKRISSRVAPASSAARMWRRVPSGLRFVQAAFKPTLTNSMNLRGRTPVPWVRGHLHAGRPTSGPMRAIVPTPGPTDRSRCQPAVVPALLWLGPPDLVCDDCTPAQVGPAPGWERDP